MSVGSVSNTASLDAPVVAKTSIVKDFWKSRSLERDLQGLSSEQLHQWIQDAVSVLPMRSESFLALERMSKAISWKALEQAIGVNDVVFQALLSGLHDQMHSLIQTELPCKRGSFKGRVVDWVSAWPQVLDNFLNAFGILDFFQMSDNPDQIEHKRTKLLTVFPLISIATVGFVSGVSVVSGAMISVGGCVLLALLSYLHSQFRSFPKSLPKAENWTEKCRQGDLDTVAIRRPIVDEIARGLNVGRKMRQFVMLTGKSGAGKTEVVKSLVHALERGVYPELKGKTVFYVNMANLLNNTESNIPGNRIFSYLSDLMGRHRDRIILVIDGIELAYHPDIESLLGDQLKAMMDFPDEKFPYVVGITTGHNRLMKTSSRYQSLAARSLQVQVDDLKDHEMLELLQCSLMKLAPHVTVEAPGLDVLVQKIKQVFGNRVCMPAVALSILARCIHKLEGSQLKLFSEKIHKQRNTIQHLYRERMLKLPDDVLRLTLEQSGVAMEKELKALEQEFLAVQQQMSDLQSARCVLFEMKKALFKIASEGVSISDKQKVLFVLLGLYWAPLTKHRLQQESARLGVAFEIDAPLIDEAIREELSVFRPNAH